jgi:streptogramin lyase
VWIGDEYTGLHSLDPTDGWNSYPSTDSSPSSYWIGALAVDEQGRVWAGNDWGTLNVLNSDERWITYTVPGMQILPFALPPIVKDIAFDNQGRVWIGTAIG